MARGSVKSWNERKGVGVIAVDGGPEIYVEREAISGYGYQTLEDGQRVEFDIAQLRQGAVAERVQVIR